MLRFWFFPDTSQSQLVELTREIRRSELQPSCSMTVPFAQKNLGKSQFLRVLNSNGAENRVILLTRPIRMDVTWAALPPPPICCSEHPPFFAWNALLYLCSQEQSKMTSKMAGLALGPQRQEYFQDQYQDAPGSIRYWVPVVKVDYAISFTLPLCLSL